MPLAWETTTSPSAGDVEAVTEGVFSHGRSLAANGRAQPIACFARLGDVVIAGAAGKTEYGRLFVGGLWVSAEMRNRDLEAETSLRLEAEAARRGCTPALIATLSDRTAGLYGLYGLYGRLGCRTVAQVTQYVGPFNRHIMLKALPDAVAPTAV